MGKYQAYPKYQESGEEWLGKVPNHWKVIQIKHLSSVKRGASPRPIDDPKYFDEDGEYVWTRIADVTASDVYLTKAPQRLSDLGSSLSVKLEPESLFLSIAGTVGKPCIAGMKACIHDGFVYFPELKIPSKFLFYVFAGEQAYKGLGKFGTQLNLNTDTVGGIKIGCTENEELEKIVNFLDHETAKIDTLIEKQQQLIALLKEKRQAVISHAVTKGLNANAPMRDSGVEWLGEVPEHWEVMYIKHLSTVKRGASPRPIDDQRYFDDNGDYAWVRIADVSKAGMYLTSTTQRLSALGASLSVKLEADQLFVSIAGTVGKPCLTISKACIHDGFVYFPELKINNKFLYYIFEAGEAYLGLGKMGTQLNLNTESVGGIKVGLPSNNEIEVIISFIEESNVKYDVLINKANHSINLMQERRTALISAAVTGKIDVRSWMTPEPSDCKNKETAG
ncbi:MAG: type I restriction enzyme S subunit [Oleispira sp.]|jgi:type I restriction enzyme S subunit